MNKNEYDKVKDNYKSTDKIPLICPYCQKEHTALKSNIQRRFRENQNALIFCSPRCSFKYKNPWPEKNCITCGKIFCRKPSELKVSNFCSSSCAATHNYKKRLRTKESSEKTSNSLKEYYRSNFPDEGFSLESLRKCPCCGSDFVSQRDNQTYCSAACRKSTNRKKPKERHSKRVLKTCIKFQKCKGCDGWALIVSSLRKQSKYCSPVCSKRSHSRQQSERLSKPENRTNLGRGKKSYLEKSFEEWLTSFDIPFEAEVKIYNTELNKNYFVDFLFKDLNLVVELDGTQHEKTKEQDAIRDDYIQRVIGYKVLRIKHKEYVKKSRYEEICNLLGFCDVEWYRKQ